MKVSVLMPSRGRPDLAQKAVESFKAHENFHFIVAVDEDDPRLEEYPQEYPQVDAMIMITKPHGYRQLHRYYNEMCKRVAGDWLMLFNDDAVLESDPELLASYIREYDPTAPWVLNPYHPNDNLFPIISRKFYEIIKHYSLSPHVDSWVQAIGEETKIQEHIPNIIINHYREQMDDETYRNSRKAVQVTAPEYNAESMVALRQIDINRIREWLNNENNR